MKIEVTDTKEINILRDSQLIFHKESVFSNIIEILVKMKSPTGH